jgi:hypothetical protein
MAISCYGTHGAVFHRFNDQFPFGTPDRLPANEVGISSLVKFEMGHCHQRTICASITFISHEVLSRDVPRENSWPIDRISDLQMFNVGHEIALQWINGVCATAEY